MSDVIRKLQELTEQGAAERERAILKKARKRRAKARRMRSLERAEEKRAAAEITAGIIPKSEKIARTRTGSLMKVMALYYGEDFLAPPKIEDAANGRYRYIFEHWMMVDTAKIGPGQLRGVAKRVYAYCRHVGFKVSFISKVNIRSYEAYCDGDYYDREKIFMMEISWKPTEGSAK